MASITGSMPVAVSDTREDVAKLITRLTVSVLILFHCVSVLNGEQAIRDYLGMWGLPLWLAYTAALFEGIAPIMVILGVYARVGALMMSFWMTMAFLLAHITTGHIFQVNQVGFWAVETPFFFLAMSFVVLLQGAGKYGLNIGGRWN